MRPGLRHARRSPPAPAGRRSGLLVRRQLWAHRGQPRWWLLPLHRLPVQGPGRHRVHRRSDQGVGPALPGLEPGLRRQDHHRTRHHQQLPGHQERRPGRADLPRQPASRQDPRRRAPVRLALSCLSVSRCGRPDPRRRCGDLLRRDRRLVVLGGETISGRPTERKKPVPAPSASSRHRRPGCLEVRQVDQVSPWSSWVTGSATWPETIDEEFCRTARAASPLRLYWKTFENDLITGVLLITGCWRGQLRGRARRQEQRTTPRPASVRGDVDGGACPWDDTMMEILLGLPYGGLDEGRSRGGYGRRPARASKHKGHRPTWRNAWCAQGTLVLLGLRRQPRRRGDDRRRLAGNSPRAGPSSSADRCCSASALKETAPGPVPPAHDWPADEQQSGLRGQSTASGSSATWRPPSSTRRAHAWARQAGSRRRWVEAMQNMVVVWRNEQEGGLRLLTDEETSSRSSSSPPSFGVGRAHPDQRRDPALYEQRARLLPCRRHHGRRRGSTGNSRTCTWNKTDSRRRRDPPGRCDVEPARDPRLFAVNGGKMDAAATPGANADGRPSASSPSSTTAGSASTGAWNADLRSSCGTLPACCRPGRDRRCASRCASTRRLVRRSRGLLLRGLFAPPRRRFEQALAAGQQTPENGSGRRVVGQGATDAGQRGRQEACGRQRYLRLSGRWLHHRRRK